MKRMITRLMAVLRFCHGHFRLGQLALFCCCFSFLFFSSGCSNRTTTDAIRTGIATGSLETLEQDLEETHGAYDEFVTALNLARVYQINGRWADSIKAFEDALLLLEDYENRAIINVRDLLAKTGTVLFSRGSEEYYGVGYERSLLHTFNALNYLMLGDFSGAAVEMRRMDKRQELWLEESQARIEKHLEKAEQRNTSGEFPPGYSMRNILESQEVRDLINSYQDPFSYSLGSILYRLAQDPQAAEVSMRRAIALNDNANILFSSVWPGNLSDTPQKEDALPPPEIPPLPQFPANEEQTDQSTPRRQELTVIAFSGLAPALQVENVRVWLPPIGYILVDLPSYVTPVAGSTPSVSVDDGLTPIDVYPLLRTDLLAYRTLRDEAHMETISAVSRALTRAGVSATTYALARSHRDTQDFAPLIAAVTTVIMDFFASSLAESARNWETLPQTGYLAMTAVPYGSTATIIAGNNTFSIDLPPDVRGVIIMATELSNSNLKVDYVTY